MPLKYLNKKAVRTRILERAKLLRAHEFTQVSEDALITLETDLILLIDRKIHTLPSKGKTITF